MGLPEAESHKAQKSLPGFEFSFADLGCTGLGDFKIPLLLLGFTLAPLLVLRRHHWRMASLLVLSSGLPLCLDYCPACGEQRVTVIHAFAQCPATQCVIDEAIVPP